MMNNLLTHNKPPQGDVVVYIKRKKDVKRAREIVAIGMESARGKVIAEYIEDARPSRPNYKPMLIKAVDKVNDKANRQLLVPSIGYLTRNMTAITEFLRLKGVNLHPLIALGEWNRKLEFIEMHPTSLLIAARDMAKRSAQNKRDGIARKKATGWKAGNPKLNIATLNASRAREELADEYTKNIIKTIRQIQSYDQTTLQQIANALMQRGLKTRRGKETWTPAGVSNILKRATKLRI
jgi:hypothetical protein